jgi:hypothetical protein
MRHFLDRQEIGVGLAAVIDGGLAGYCDDEIDAKITLQLHYDESVHGDFDARIEVRLVPGEGAILLPEKFMLTVKCDDENLLRKFSEIDESIDLKYSKAVLTVKGECA